jgi:serine protease Do
MVTGCGLRIAAAILSFLCCPLFSAAETLKITTTPPGAKVEIDGIAEGTTPFEKDYPGGYFHRPRTSIGSRLEHALVARVTLAGYATKEIQLTDGPMNWVSLNGRNRSEYWLFKADHFEVELQPIGQVFTGGVTAKLAGGVNADLRPELALEELVRRTKPAVVLLKRLDGSGTGFFVTETGVIATNAHVARGEETLLTLLPGGEQLEAKVVYVDDQLDIALAKVEGKEFPHLPLADAATIRQGENVIAIGNPGDAMLFSVTKGIVSAVGKFPNAGPGTWIQTDTPINPGNSGGPLLNARGEVIGINTQKLVKKNVSGIGFALSASDLLEVLHRFYPNVANTQVTASAAATAGAGDRPARASSVGSTASTATSPSSAADAAATSAAAEADPQPLVSKPMPAAQQPDAPAEAASSASPAAHGFGIVTITSDPEGAEIYVDEKFVGNAPAKLKLAAGSHTMVVKASGFAEWKRTIEILKDSQVMLRPELDRKP